MKKCIFYLFDKVLGLGACAKTGLFCNYKDCPFRKGLIKWLDF